MNSEWIIAEATRENQVLHGIGTGNNFLDNTLKAQETKAKIKKISLNQIFKLT